LHGGGERGGDAPRFAASGGVAARDCQRCGGGDEVGGENCSDTLADDATLSAQLLANSDICSSRLVQISVSAARHGRRCCSRNGTLQRTGITIAAGRAADEPKEIRSPQSENTRQPRMNLRRSVILVILGLGACATSTPSAVPQTDDRADPTPHVPITCDEQVAQVQPLPTGRSRERYVRGCLIEHQFAAYLWERQTCDADGECAVIQTACPFGCGVAVAKAYVADVSAEHDRLVAEFNQHANCKYKCNHVVGATCVQHRCRPRRLIEDTPSKRSP